MTAVEADQVEIQTGDGVSFALPLAGPVSRFLALMVDWSVIATAVYLLSLAFRYIPGLPDDVKSAGSVCSTLYSISGTELRWNRCGAAGHWANAPLDCVWPT